MKERCKRQLVMGSDGRFVNRSGDEREVRRGPGVHTWRVLNVTSFEEPDQVAWRLSLRQRHQSDAVSETHSCTGSHIGSSQSQ